MWVFGKVTFYQATKVRTEMANKEEKHSQLENWEEKIQWQIENTNFS